MRVSKIRLETLDEYSQLRLIGTPVNRENRLKVQCACPLPRY